MVNLTPEINHEYDFSYSIPNLNAVYALTKYLYNEYENLLALIKADEINNEKFREEIGRASCRERVCQYVNI